MGKTLRQKQKNTFKSNGIRKTVSSNYATKTQIMGPYGPMVIKPSRLPPGWQDVRMHVPMKVVSCLEAECSIFLNDRVDPYTQKVIPAGSKPCGAQHKMWNGRPLIYYIQYGGEEVGRFVSESEFVDELCAGLDHGFEIQDGRR